MSYQDFDAELYYNKDKEPIRTTQKGKDIFDAASKAGIYFDNKIKDKDEHVIKRIIISEKEK